MKYLWMLLTSFSFLSLNAKNIQIELPPSNQPWTIAADYHDGLLTQDPQENPDFSAQIYTHREKDALEILITIEATLLNSENNLLECLFTPYAEDQSTIKEQIENELNPFQYLYSDHRITLKNFEHDENNCMMFWICENQSNHLFYGITRAFKNENKMAVLHYLTTADIHEPNIYIWEKTLSQATLISDQKQ